MKITNWTKRYSRQRVKNLGEASAQVSRSADGSMWALQFCRDDEDGSEMIMCVALDNEDRQSLLRRLLTLDDLEMFKAEFKKRSQPR